MRPSAAYNIPAKQVTYNGITYRSKNEAKWAIIWDYLKIAVEYAPERYIGFGGTPYEPDFYFPGYDLYGEVKATDAQLFESAEKISGAIDFGSTPISHSNGLLLLGPPPFSSAERHGYAVHGCYLYWDEGVNCGDFFILPVDDPERKSFATFRLNKNYRDISSYSDLPPSATVDLELTTYNEISSLHLALGYARSARFDFDDSFERMFAENRTIIGGN